jgi:hypothetical protein
MKVRTKVRRKVEYIGKEDKGDDNGKEKGGG